MKGKKYSFIYLIVICVSMMLFGCTIPLVVPDHISMNFDKRPKINLNVKVQITDNIKDAKYDLFQLGTYQLGTGITNGINKFANNVFEDFVITNSGETKPVEKRIDAVLTPKLLRVEGAIGTWAKADAVTTIIMEWTLVNNKGDIIWVDTVKGVAHSITGYGWGEGHYMKMANIRMENAIRDLFIKSYDSIYSSAAIKKLSKI